MIVNYSSNYSQSPYFGMLNMTSYEENKKALGKKLADSGEVARPALEKLAEDYDITVWPRTNDALNYRGFNIRIQALKPSAPEPTPVIENPIKRVFANISAKFKQDVDSRPYLDGEVMNLHTWKADMPTLLVDKTNELVERFKKYAD